MNTRPDSNDESADGTTHTLAPAGMKRRFRWALFALPALAAALGAGAWLLRGDDAKAAPAAPTQGARIEGSRIVYSKEFAERAGIRTAHARSAPLVPVITAVGTVDFNPEHVAAVGARLRGLVTRVTKFEGDNVEPGMVLAVIESAELGEAQAAVSTLEAEKAAADLNLVRETTLSEKRLSTAREREVAAVEAERYEHLLGAARQKVKALVGRSPGGGRLGAHELRAPMKGTVVERSVAPGQTVDGELVAFRVANTEHLWVELDVFEKNLALVRVGDKVELSPLAAPQQSFEGRVARVGAVIDSETRSAPVRIEIENANGLRAGQAVNARIHASGGEKQASVLVPTTAITFVDGKPTLFVVKAPGAVEVATAEVGFSNGAETAVTGVPADAEVVSDGVFALKSELFR